ncbi:hypothetical protein [Streptomyces sp. NPDC048636]|uniref:hypothetical protein n=1 Tax=Streptomyces sp. NPDC048636 TaxID=3155762 RepID=UPI00341F3FD0
MTGIAAMALVGMSAATAAAGTSVSAKGERGAAYFQHNGDKLTVYDYKKDGWGVEGEVSWKSGGRWRSANVKPGGGGQHASQSLNIKEGTEIQLILFYIDPDGAYINGRVHTGRA